MKRLPWFVLIIIIVFAAPALAQDDGGGFGGGFGGGDFGGGDAGGGFNGGFGGGDTFGADISTAEGPGLGNAGVKVDVLADLRRWLERAGAPPIDKNQEKPLSKLYDREVKLMAKSFQSMFGIPMTSALAAQSGSGRGRRGGGRTTPPEQIAEIHKLTGTLMDVIIADLKMDQQGALRKYQSEQLRVSRQAAMKLKLKTLGVSLTPEQNTDLEAIFARESRIRTLVIVEAKGAATADTITSLEKQTSQRVLHVLNPTQRATITAALAKPKTP